MSRELEISDAITFLERGDNRPQIARYERAKLLLMMNEINLLREWNAQLQDAVLNAASLADLKERVSALPALEPRTKEQVKNALIAKISGAESDA